MTPQHSKDWTDQAGFESGVRVATFYTDFSEQRRPAMSAIPLRSKVYTPILAEILRPPPIASFTTGDTNSHAETYHFCNYDPMDHIRSLL